MVCLGTYRVPAFMTVAWLCVWLITATLYAGETTPSEPPPEDRASVHLMDRVVDAASPGWARLLLRLDGDASGDRVTLERLRDGVTTARAALQRWLANPEDGVLSRALAIALAIQLQDGWLDPTDKAQPQFVEDVTLFDPNDAWALDTPQILREDLTFGLDGTRELPPNLLPDLDASFYSDGAVSPVPEPSSGIVLLVGAAGLARRQRRV